MCEYTYVHIYIYVYFYTYTYLSIYVYTRNNALLVYMQCLVCVVYDFLVCPVPSFRHTILASARFGLLRSLWLAPLTAARSACYKGSGQTPPLYPLPSPP